MRFAAAALLLAAAGQLGPGQAGTTFSYVDQYPYYGSAAVAYAASGGIINTEILGQPFAGAQNEPEAIAALVRMPGWHPQARPTTLAAPDRPANNHRLVFVFHPARGFPEGSKICGPPGRYRAGPPAGPVRVHGAFCAGDELVAEAFGVGAAQGPGDPAFAQLLNQLMLVMLPPPRREFPNRGNRLFR